MNMIVNTSDLVGYEAENKKSKENSRKEVLAKLVAAWESKNSRKAKKFSTLGLLAVSLAACNSDDDDGDSDDAGMSDCEVGAGEIVFKDPSVQRAWSPPAACAPGAKAGAAGGERKSQQNGKGGKGRKTLKDSQKEPTQARLNTASSNR